MYQRAVDEFIAEVSDYATKFQILRALKDALPENLQVLLIDRMSVQDMKEEDARDVFMTWLRTRYETTAGTDAQDNMNEFNKFMRTTSSLRDFIDSFEHLILKLQKDGLVFSDVQQRGYLIAKAELPAEVLADLQLSMHRRGKSAYTDVREELLLIGAKPSLFVRAVHRTEATPTKQQVNEVHFQQRDDKGKGGRGRKGSKPICWHYQKGTCQRGNDCFYEHVYERGGKKGAGKRGRSTSPSGGGKGRSYSPRGRSYSRSRDTMRDFSSAPDRSRSRSRHYARVPCRDFSNGKCNYGSSCRFSHDRSDQPRRFAGRSSSRSPKGFGGGKGGWRDRSNSRGKNGGGKGRRGSSSRSPRPRA
jgi:hypothetical protein